jgi:hypothetical protein
MSGTPADQGHEHVHPQRRILLWGARALGYVVYAYVVVTEIILGLGFVLLLFGANPDPSFVQWVYRSLDRAMEPFRGIFTPIELGAAGGNEVESVLDTSVLFAMIVYGIAAWAVHAFIEWLSHRLALLDRRDLEYRQQQAAQGHWRPDASDPSYPTRPGPGSQPDRPDTR